MWPGSGGLASPRWGSASPPARYETALPGLATEGEYESDERPEVGGTYKLEDCELLDTDKTFYGDILITSAEAEMGGAYHGSWRAVGEVTGSARA